MSDNKIRSESRIGPQILCLLRRADMTRLLTFAVFALLPMLAWGEGYICIADMETGFAYDNGRWRETRLRPRTIILRPAAPNEAGIVDPAALDQAGMLALASWVAIEVGDHYPFASCFENPGAVWCRGLGHYIEMSRQNLRFVYAQTAGYVEGPPDPQPFTPSIAIGKCSPM
jgi:hypothetical protein